MGPLAPRLLALGGLLPFVLLAAVVTADYMGWRPWATNVLMVYGALILAFVGGVSWGAALRQDGSGPFLWSMAPFFSAWVALYLPLRWGAGLLVVAFLAAYTIDRQAHGRGLVPDWFIRLRGLLTVVVVLSLLVALPALQE